MPVPRLRRTGWARLAGTLVLAATVVVAIPATTVLAQDAPAPAPSMGAGDLLIQFAPILLLVVIFWFLIFRPQQKRLKAQQAMLSAIKRGDTVVTTGGILGKVTKAVDGEDLEVEIATGVKVKLVRGMVADVRSKGEPVNDNKPA